MMRIVILKPLTATIWESPEFLKSSSTSFDKLCLSHIKSPQRKLAVSGGYTKFISLISHFLVLIKKELYPERVFQTIRVCFGSEVANTDFNKRYF